MPTDLSKTAHGPFRTPKSSPRRLTGASPSTLPAALGHPEEPPRSRQAENMQTAAEGAPTPAARPEHLVPVGTTSPPRCKHYFLTLPHRSSRLSVLSLPPPTPDPRGRRSSFWGWGAGGLGLGALGWTGLVLPATAQNPARLVYGSAALVASLRGQQSHFTTLPINLAGLRSSPRLPY